MKFFRPLKPFLLLTAAFAAFGATSPAIYLHHQQSSLAALEADLQNREIGLDFANKTAVGKFTDGTKFHLISQEMPNVALAGNLTVSGNAVISGQLTASGATAFGSSLTSTSAGSGTSSAFIASSAAPTMTWVSTASALNAKNWDIQATGNSLLFRTRTDANASGTDWLTVTRSGTSVSSAAFGSKVTSTDTIRGVTLTAAAASGNALVNVDAVAGNTRSLTFRSSGGQRWDLRANSTLESGSNAGSNFELNAYTDAGAFIDAPVSIVRAAGGTMTLARPVTASSGITITGGADAAGRLIKDAGFGISLRGASATNYDLSLLAASGAWLLRNPTGTTNLEFPTGTTNFTGNATFNGTVTANASVVVPDAAGLITVISSTNRALAYRNGTVLNIGENGGWTGINYRLPTGAAHTFQVNGSTVATVDATGVDTPGRLSFSGNGTSVAGSIYRTAAAGLILRGITGSSYDLLIANAAASDLIRNPTGTTNLQLPGADVNIAGTATTTGLLTANGGLTLGASFTDKTTSITSTTTLGTSHSTILANATSGALTLNLPAASGKAGLTYTILKTDASTNSVTVDGNASETIAGKLTISLVGNLGNSRMVIVCDGTNWRAKDIYDEGSVALTATGFGAPPAVDGYFVRQNRMVTFMLPTISATSNANTFTFTGLSSSIAPPTTQYFPLAGFVDNGIAQTSAGIISVSSSAISFGKTADPSSLTGWTASGTKGLSGWPTITWTLI